MTQAVSSRSAVSSAPDGGLAPAPQPPVDERDAIRQDIASPERFARGYEALKARLRGARTLREFHFAAGLLESFRDDPARQPFAQSVRVALLAAHTVDFLPPLLAVDLMLEDVRCDVYRPHHNQFRQEVLAPRSGLFAFRPQVAIVAFDLETVFPDAVAAFPELGAEGRDAFAGDVLSLVETVIDNYRANLGGQASVLLVQDWVPPFQSYAPLLPSEGDWPRFVARLNQSLRELCARKLDTHALPYAQLAAERGLQRFTDPRTYYTAQIPVAQEHWLALTDLYTRYVSAILGRGVKCLVLDLDNTLWGGVLGEDGPHGVHVGPTYPGSVFRRFQEHLLALNAAGYVLAICSKNDAGDVETVLRDNKWMVLREQHFAAIHADWREKASNVEEISREINLTLDQMLFVDDNPLEIAKMKATHPQLRCLHLESPPLRFAEQLASMRCLGKLAVSEQDRQRARQYFGERKRRELRETQSSVDDFLRGLEQRVTIYTSHAPHRDRIADLTQRTNQFNLTTLRLTTSEVDELLASPDHLLLTAELADRFGDSGIVAYAQVRKGERVWVIENFLMSCRVLGRTVERTLIDWIVERARAQGVESVLAGYSPTKKNAPFAEFWSQCGFSELPGESAAGVAESQSESERGGTMAEELPFGKVFVRRVAEHQSAPRLLEIVEHGP